MTMTIMYLTVAFLITALAVTGYTRVRGLEFAYGSPVAIAAMLLVIALIIDLGAQLTLSTQGWLLTSGSQQKWLWKIGLALQGLAIVFLVLGIWRLFAAVGQILPAGKTRASRAIAPNANADTTD